jgi:hypothetical protein
MSASAWWQIHAAPAEPPVRAEPHEARYLRSVVVEELLHQFDRETGSRIPIGYGPVSK